MSFLIRIAAISLLTVLMACAPIRQQVQLPPERSFHRGFSLVLPNEKGWVYFQRDHNTLVVSKYGSSPDETYVIQTNIWGLPSLTSQTEFMDVVKEMEAKGTDPSRFKVLMHGIASFPRKGGYCARSHLIAEDRAAVKRIGGVHTMILEIVHLTCRHPKNANVAISVGYSYRHFAGHEDADFLKKATELFEDIEFTDLK